MYGVGKEYREAGRVTHNVLGWHNAGCELLMYVCEGADKVPYLLYTQYSDTVATYKLVAEKQGEHVPAARHWSRPAACSSVGTS